MYYTLSPPSSIHPLYLVSVRFLGSFKISYLSRAHTGRVLIKVSSPHLLPSKYGRNKQGPTSFCAAMFPLKTPKYGLPPPPPPPYLSDTCVYLIRVLPLGWCWLVELVVLTSIETFHLISPSILHHLYRYVADNVIIIIIAQPILL